MPAVSFAKVAGAWSAIGLLLVATHGCTYAVAWSNARAAAAASEVRDVRATAAAAVDQARDEAVINVAVISDTVRQEAAAASTFREIRKEVPRAFANPDRMSGAGHPWRDDAPAGTPCPAIRGQALGAAASANGTRKDASPCPACLCGFSADARRLWNDALAATVPHTPGGTAPPAAGSGAAAAESDAGTDLEDVLRNHVDNAEVHAHNRRQCDGLLAWHRKHRERAP